jgi:hypothetical protein
MSTILENLLANEVTRIRIETALPFWIFPPLDIDNPFVPGGQARGQVAVSYLRPRITISTKDGGDIKLQPLGDPDETRPKVNAAATVTVVILAGVAGFVVLRSIT